MLVEQLRRQWSARERAASFRPVMSLESEGLVLGAGTLLVPSHGKRRLARLQGKEARILTLLSAAYGRPVPLAVLGKIDRAAKCWAEGEDCLASIHLALAGLNGPTDRREAARRLFMADGLMKAGVAPHTVMQALDLDASVIEAIEKLYDAAEARVPAGSGTDSGEWTSGSSVLADLSMAAARFLQSFIRYNEVTLAVGLLLIPEDNGIHVEGDVADLPGLHYAWNRDESHLRLTYKGRSRMRVIDAVLGTDGVFRDGGKVVARILPDGTLAVDPAAVSADLADQDGPNLCPVATKDNAGRSGAPGEKDKDYEDQIKRIVNPDNPTPRGYAYRFFNQDTGNWVKVDDCQHQTSARVEIKSEYDDLLDHDWGRKSLREDWLDQSARYIQVSPNSPVIWVFAQGEAADFARSLFRNGKDGQQRIITVVIPRVGG